MCYGEPERHADEATLTLEENTWGSPASGREHGETLAMESRRESQAQEEKLRREEHPWVEALKDVDGDRVGALAPRAAGLATAGRALVSLLAGGKASDCLGLCAFLDSGQGSWLGLLSPMPTPGDQEDEDPGCPA